MVRKYLESIKSLLEQDPPDVKLALIQTSVAMKVLSEEEREREHIIQTLRDQVAADDPVMWESKSTINTEKLLKEFGW